MSRGAGDKERAARILDEARRSRTERDQSYRGRALKILPWVCGSCGRDFESRNLQELTVHHKDHDHTNNPPDGSNWELLCYWCHDNEHSRLAVAEASGKGRRAESKPRPMQSPFAGLERLLEGED
jgi:5-methylcytosine-specific restriction endonuclease McrA